MKEYPKAWIEALRSGKYFQTRGRLRDSTIDGQFYFCCLGVRCDIEDSTKWHNDTWSLCANVLPQSIYDSDGFSECRDRNVRLPIKSREGDIFRLSGLNDEGFTFSQIADIIECFWEQL